MTETVAPVAKSVSRPRPRKPATVSTSALALHLDCSRTYIGKLEAEGDPAAGRRLPARPEPRHLPAVLAARGAPQVILQNVNHDGPMRDPAASTAAVFEFFVGL
jgi:hypothetical protein